MCAVPSAPNLVPYVTVTAAKDGGHRFRRAFM